jgi:enoyl-CoA hydratase/carnithine racemase
VNPSEVLVTRDGPIVTLTFNRPEARNAMTWQMYERLYQTCEEVDADDSVRVLVLRGDGPGFSAGLDLQDFFDSARHGEAALRAARELEFGGVTVNEAPTFRADQMPYGGVKDSGNTREGPAYAIRELTEERLIVLNV